MMIGSAVKSTTGKKILGIFVAIAMVLTMSNISAYYASAQEQAEKEAQKTEESTPVEKVEKEEAPEPAASADEENGDADTDGSDKAAIEFDNEVEDKAADQDADDPTDEGTGDDEGDDNATNDDDNDWSKKKHHITITLKLYKDGGYVTKVSKTEEGPIGMNVDFDVDAYIASMKGWGTAKYTQESTKTYGTYSIKSGWNSIDETIELYYSPDVLVGSDKKRESDGYGDGIADKYQTTVTYTVVNGSWNDGTNKAKTQIVTFMNNGKPSNDADAWSGVLNFPEVGANPDEHFSAGNWSEKPEVLTSYVENPVFTYDYEADVEGAYHKIDCKVYFYLDGQIQEQYTDNVSLSAPWAQSIDYDKGIVDAAVARNPMANAVRDFVEWKHFDPNGLLSEDGTFTLDAKAENVTLGYVNVYFAKDVIGTSASDKSDGVADKYQVALNFKVVNGRLAKSEEATKVVTLRNAEGTITSNGTADVVLPSVKPDNGYFSGSWKDENGKSQSGTITVKKGDDGKTLTYTFIPQSYEYYVMYFDDVTSMPIWETLFQKAPYGSVIKADDVIKEIPGYVYSWTNVPELTIDTFEQGNGIGLFYDVDANNDGIADKFQVTVTYTAVNGTVTGEATEIVTLYDENGNFSTTGTGHLTHIPTFAPLDGYEGGTWGAAGQPTGTTKITKNTNFVITYTAKVPVVTDEDPTEPEDNDNNGTTNNDNAGAGLFNGNYTPAAGDDAAADEATEPEADEDEVIEDTENPLVSLPDEQTIVDDENALAGYEQGSEQTWLPFAIVAGIACAGLFLFLIARRKKDEEDARSTY